MISKVKAVVKLATAALLFCAAAPLYADGAPFVPPTQILGFTEANQTPPFITSKDMTRGTAEDGSLTFSLDLHFGTNTPKSFAILPMIQYDSAKLDIIEISNVAHAGFFKPEPSRVNDRKFKIADWSRKPAFAGADTEFLLVWMDLNEITAVSGATPENPVRLATIKFQWKAGAVGASQIAIVESEAGVSDENFRGVSVDIQGIEVAEATEAAVGVRAPPAATAVPEMTFSTKYITIAEGDAETFQVSLTASPGGNVVVDISSDDESGLTVTVTPASLTFTATDWKDHPVTVHSEANAQLEADKHYTIYFTADNGKIAFVPGTVTDKGAAVFLSADPAYLCEAGVKHEITLTATLRGAASIDDDLLLELGTDGTAVESEDYEIDLPNSPEDVRENAAHGIAFPKGATFASATFSITPKVVGASKTLVIGGRAYDHAALSVGNKSELKNITFVPAKLAIHPILDVDSDDEITPRDGIMIARYLLDVTRGQGLTDGQANTKGDLPKIKAHLDKCRDGLEVDEYPVVDSDDGILIARYLLGLRGLPLVKNLPWVNPKVVKQKMEELMKQTKKP